MGTKVSLKVNLAGIRAALKGKQLTGFAARKARGATPAGTAHKIGQAKLGQVKSVSDVRAKRDIVHVAQLDNGINLYRYRYKWSDQTYVGVIAQEILQIVPDAVDTGADGYLRVDYARLGLKPMLWDEWISADRA